MKFAQYLNEHAVPEWKTQYLDYKQGKKKLKKVNESPYFRETVSQKSATPKTDDLADNNNATTRPARADFPPAKIYNPHQEGTPAESMRTGGNRSSFVSFQLPPPAMRDLPANGQHQDKDFKSEAQVPNQNDRTPLLSPEQVPHSDHQSTSLQSTPIFKNPAETNSGPSPNAFLTRRKSRIGSFVKNFTPNLGLNSSNNTSSQELTSFSNYAQTEFIAWCDSELFKVESFYRDNEKRTMERFLILQDQLFQLREQRVLRKIMEKNFERRHELERQGLSPNSKAIDKAERHSAMKMKYDEVKAKAQIKAQKINKLELPSFPSLYWFRGEERQKEYYDKGYYSDEGEGDHDDEESSSPRNDDGDDGEGAVDTGSSASLSHSELEQSTHTSKLPQDPRFNKRDYSRKDKRVSSIPYYIARRQLKTALLELYRSLELLKSYRLINRTAFRKMLKKFDKTAKTNMSPEYMQKVDKCYFCKSELCDELIGKIEELYSATFENGNRKTAIAKLRSNENIATFYLDFFLSGWFLGLGIPLFILALHKGLHDTITGILPEGRYLLQIWGGFVLATLLALLFAINCFIWTKYKINYKFIFEFDSRTAIDFRQFPFLPCLSFFLLSLFGWLSFENFWPTKLPGRFWPWFYVGFMICVIFCPFQVFFYHSRKWMLTSMWRLLLSGFYPVEFRDFFLGDIFCSLTYSISNISFFLCLYATHWDGALTGNDTKCGSQHSRVMGFLATVPSLWRFMQCIRRYSDTGDWFPHLANCAKYTISTLYYLLLSVYRIDRNTQNRAVFIVFAAINSIYSSIWDIFMDWSLVQAGSKNFLLRDDLIFKNPYYYYVAMVFDVLMRFQWIFYAFFQRQVQQSAVTSFCIALAEVLRRFVWVFFRLENEHCTNVHLFRASRETPLPYPINKAKIAKKLQDFLSRIKPLELDAPVPITPHEDEERLAGFRRQSLILPEQFEVYNGPTVEEEISGEAAAQTPGLTRRATVITQSIAKFSKILNNAHIKDFQRRKLKPEDAFHKDDSDDEDDDNDSEDEDDHHTRRSPQNLHADPDEDAREQRAVEEYVGAERDRQAQS